MKNITLAFVSLLILLAMPAQAADEMQRDAVTVRTAEGEEFIFNVEMALSSSEQSRGLMNRTSLDENAGMLFVFGGEAKRSFWMRNTLIPLDILFLAKDGTIHHIHHMAKPQNDAHISSQRPVKAVLEINGGLADKWGIKEGDTVIHSAFRNKLDE